MKDDHVRDEWIEDCHRSIRDKIKIIEKQDGVINGLKEVNEKLVEALEYKIGCNDCHDYGVKALREVREIQNPDGVLPGQTGFDL